MKLPILQTGFLQNTMRMTPDIQMLKGIHPGKDNQSRVEAKEIKPKKVCRVHTRAQPDAQRCNNRTAPAYN